MKKNAQSGSGKLSLNKEDLMDALRTAFMVGIAAALTFIVDNIGNIQMGESVLMVLPMVVMGLKAAINWINDNTFDKEEEEVVEETAE